MADLAVSCVSPSRTVPTAGTVYHKLMASLDDPRGEPPLMMARAALLLASEPADEINGRVTYSQQILQEFGWIEKGVGPRRRHGWHGLFTDLRRVGRLGATCYRVRHCGWTHGQSRPSGARRADRSLPAVANHGACRLRLRCAWLEPGRQRSRPAGYVGSRCSLGCLGYRGPAGGACRTLRTTSRSGRGEGDPQSISKGIDPPRQVGPACP